MVREILVVPRAKLFKNKKEFNGFLALSGNEFFFKDIMNNFEYRERNDELENDPTYKQIIPYVWLINPETKKVFLYKRANTGNEKRLHNKYSGGVGGHIDKDTEEKSSDPIKDAMMRELHEEVIMKDYPSPKVLGFLNDENGKVEQVHFGVVAIGETKDEVKPAEDMSQGKFYSVDEIEELFNNPLNNIENWTKLSWPFVRNYLKE